jgi:hypothetical protein
LHQRVGLFAREELPGFKLRYGGSGQTMLLICAA